MSKKNKFNNLEQGSPTVTGRDVFWSETLGGGHLNKWIFIHYTDFCLTLLIDVYFGFQLQAQLDGTAGRIWSTSHQFMITDLKGPVKKNVTPSRATFDSVTKVFSSWYLFFIYLCIYHLPSKIQCHSCFLFFLCVHKTHQRSPSSCVCP